MLLAVIYEFVLKIGKLIQLLCDGNAGIIVLIYGVVTVVCKSDAVLLHTGITYRSSIRGYKLPVTVLVRG